MNVLRNLLIWPCVAALAGGCGGGKTRFLAIGTGAQTGVYYPAGGAVARIINDTCADRQIRASVESTGGSVYNINAVLKGDLQLGLAQSDRQYQAVHGAREWDGRPQERLRAICSLHPEIVTLMAAADAGIDGVPALKGKRVNLGNPGSGQLGNSLDVLGAFAIDPAADIRAEGLRAAEAPRMLQDGRIDAFFYTVGHPSGNITEAATGTRGVRLVPIRGPGIDRLVLEKPFYTRAVIPARHYPRAAPDGDVPSVGVTATIIASAELDDEVVYAVTRALFTHLDELRAMHPALESLTPQSMLQGLSAPLHRGALRYYREAGLKE